MYQSHLGDRRAITLMAITPFATPPLLWSWIGAHRATGRATARCSYDDVIYSPVGCVRSWGAAGANLSGPGGRDTSFVLFGKGVFGDLFDFLSKSETHYCILNASIITVLDALKILSIYFKISV